MQISAENLTFVDALDAYAAVLRNHPGKALLVYEGEAVFLEDGQIYGVTIDATGALDLVNAACICAVSWEEAVDSAQMCAAAVNSPVLIDLLAPEWREFCHAGKRWAFDEEQLAEWDEEAEEFHFCVYHELEHATVTSVAEFIDQLGSIH